MSARKRKVGVTVRPNLEPKTFLKLVRSVAAGEFTKSLGGSASEIETAAMGVSKGYLKSITVIGTDANGRAREESRLSFDENADGDIDVDLNGGNQIALQALDGSLLKAIQYQAERLRKKGLSVRVYYQFHDAIYADGERLAACRKDLGIDAAEAVDWADGYEPRGVLRISPAKDRGLVLSIMHAFRKR